MQTLEEIIQTQIADAVKAGQTAEEAINNLRTEYAQAIWDLELRLDVRKGLEAVAEGQTVPHEKVAEWAQSLGTENELPLPTPDDA